MRHAPFTWRLRPDSDAPLAAADSLRMAHALFPLAARVLAARGWSAGAALQAFLDPPTDEEPEASGLSGVRAAAESLWAAVDARERITICGDYDIDGICATAVLVAYLRGRGAVVDHYLPHRVAEGYGLNTAALDAMKARGTRVLVTVDNGITSHAEIAHAKAVGLTVILTDHHQPGPTLPAADIIVNPRLMADPGPFGPLSGAGVAYYVARGMDALRPPEGVDARALLDLVALGTLGDQSPLVAENRRLVRLGLRQLADSPRPGIAALARAVKCNLRLPNLGEALAQRVIPRLNAAGRMTHPTLALELLLCDDSATARELADSLETLNQQRRRLSVATETQALMMLSGTQPLTPAIVLAEAEWHHGVMSIVATRLAARFRKPVILFAREDADTWRGSGRSDGGIDLLAAITPLSHLLGRFGGHPQAVGLTVTDAQLPAFRKALYAGLHESGVAIVPPPRVWDVDAEVELAELSYDTARTLHVLEPTGAANPAPVLAARGLEIVRQELRGPEGDHLWLMLSDGTPHRVEAIGFGMGGLHPLNAEQVDIVFVPMAERWQGKSRLTLKLLAIREAEPLH